MTRINGFLEGRAFELKRLAENATSIYTHVWEPELIEALLTTDELHGGNLSDEQIATILLSVANNISKENTNE